MNLPILKYPSGKSGYNKKIKQLLKDAGIDRKVTEFDEVEGVNKYIPICETSSSKLARSTHVDMMNKVQINIYAAGLHRQGSGAVTHYTMLELADRFKLMNLAFDQEDYRVNKKLEVFDSSVENMSALAFRTSLKSALKQDGMGFKVVIWRKTVPQNKTALRARRVLEFLISQPTISTEEIGKQWGVISCKSSIL